MDNAADFKERFRQARQKRAHDRGSSSTKGTAKRHRAAVTSTELSKQVGVKTSEEKSEKRDEKAPERVLSKEETDRMLMPPPPSLATIVNTSAVEAIDDEAEDRDDGETGDLQLADLGLLGREKDQEKDKLPEDFFEVESKKAKAELEKERSAQRTDAEYVRFHKELEDSLQVITENEYLEAEESERHREEMDEHEQQQRLKCIQLKKEQRKHQTVTSPSQPHPPIEDPSESVSEEEEDDSEMQWRCKSL